MIDPYETERKLLAISSPCGARPRCHMMSGGGCYLEFATNQLGACPGECPAHSEAIRRLNELAQTLARECPLHELLAAVRETEGE